MLFPFNRRLWSLDFSPRLLTPLLWQHTQPRVMGHAAKPKSSPPPEQVEAHSLLTYSTSHSIHRVSFPMYVSGLIHWCTLFLTKSILNLITCFTSGTSFLNCWHKMLYCWFAYRYLKSTFFSVSLTWMCLKWFSVTIHFRMSGDI